ncbi:hypothetical protein DL89DRAFT_265795 [Linderina pennispora]|uniref:S1 motif domain-containing protein n=1 Tax=Linderina pennispora TaxID=61395 RepID=A0A1Y1WFI4_9FUNG|nr:uncharacterized protein DL89DRAFT_265795 [Linderina pennispora]ORX72165.1 hypothetical protein DL89DRAFT_265795 [Linderina pennispora]
MAGKGDKKHNSKKGEKKASKKIATEVEDFPRGGASGLTPLEYREVSRQAEREVLFSDGVLASDVADKKKQKKHKRRSSEDGGSVEKKKKKTKKSQPTEDVETETLDQIIDRAAPVESLSYKRLTKGALVLGCLTVDLPGAMTGHLTQMAEKMAQGDDSDDEEDGLDLGSRFYVGQYVNQTDASGKAKTRVELSLMPGDVNERIDVDDICEGLSVEDRGYVLNTGLATSKMAAFLPTKEARKWLERWMPAQGELKVGQVIEACVAKITDGRRSLQMTLDPESVAEALPKDTFKTMASVQPGQLVSATVMKVWDRGLSLRFMGFYDCSADLVSIGLTGALDKKDIAQTYDLGKIVKARVMYVSLTTASKTILVSLLPHIVEMSPRPGITGYETPAAAQLVTGSATGAGTGKFSTMDVRSKWPIPYGTVLEEVAVVGVNPHIGLTLAVPGVETVRCLARKGDLVDNKDLVPALSRTAGVFQLGSVHRVRVLGYEAMSGLVHVSLKPSVVDEPLFRIEDVVPGAVITGTVRRLKDSRLVVALSGRLTGTVAGDQLSDTHLKHPELVFKADHPVACRVLSVHAKKNDIKLTCRKSLVQSKLPVVTGFSAERGAVPGVITHATVVHHTKAGVLVSFYQGAAGMIPMADISANTKGAGKIPKQLEVGKVVKCRIVQVKPKQRRITASLNVDADTSIEDLQARPAKAATSAISKDLSQVSPGQMVSGSVVKVSSDHFTIRLDGSDLLATLHKGHLSDHTGSVLDRMAARIAVGVRFDDLVVVDLVKKHGTVKQQVLVTASEMLKVGKTVVGWVDGTAAFGVFVRFAGGVTGLAPISALGDRYTVVASVVSVEDNQTKLSLKGSVVDPLASGCIAPEDFVAEYFAQLEGPLAEQIGEQSLVVVKQKQPYGVFVEPAASELSAKERLSACKDGAVLAACVLDVDSDKNIVDYSLKATLVPDRKALDDAESRATAEQKLADARASAEKKRSDVIVEVVKEDYLVLSIPSLGHQIAYAMTKTYNDRSKPFMRYKIGQRLSGTPYQSAGSKRTLVYFQSRHSGNDDETRRKAMEPVDPALQYFEDLQPGFVTRAKVTGISGTQANLSIAANIKGRLHVTELFDDDDVADLGGETITVKVVGLHSAKVYKYLAITHRVSPLKSVIEMTVRPSELAASGTLVHQAQRQIKAASVKPGREFNGFVAEITHPQKEGHTGAPFVSVALSPKLLGKFYVTHVTGSVQVVRAARDGKSLAVQPVGALPGVPPLPASAEDLAVHTIGDTSMTPRTATEGKSRQFIRGFVNRFQFKVGQLVDAVVVPAGKDVESASKFSPVDLSLRPSLVHPESTQPVVMKASDLHEGQIVHGVVARTTDVGCFIEVGNHVRLSDEYIRDVKAAFPRGTIVKAIVTSVDKAQDRASVSLKASRIGGDTAHRRLEQVEVGERLKGTVTRIEEYAVFIKPDDVYVTGLCYDKEIADSEAPVDPRQLYEIGDRVLAKVLRVDLEKGKLRLGLKASYFAEAMPRDAEEDAEEDAEMEDASSDEEADSEEEEEAAPALTVSKGFQWGDAESDSEAASSDSESEASDAEQDAPRKKSKRNKSKLQTVDLTGDLADQAPRSTADFERLLVGSPNSSFLWLQFMAHYLEQSEVDQARAVAERALTTISPREEQERFNVWHRFGTKDSLDGVLKRAIQYMNAKHVYLQMAKIYERAGQTSPAEAMHKTATQKFPGSCKVWNAKVAESRDLLARALKALPKRKHIKAITQFGQMEFKHGEPERGRTVFEGRVDLWSVYLDMEWGATRKLFERVTSMKHSSKKMKFFFKKWLAFEKAHGDDAHVEHVKNKAREYINSL